MTNKTLKDVLSPQNDWDETSEKKCGELVKEMVIKWVKKHFENDWDCHFGFNALKDSPKDTFINRYCDGSNSDEYGNDEKDFCVGWQLMKIFNITEGELK